MHVTWFAIRWTWTAIVITYLILSIVASKRLRGEAKKRSNSIFVAIVALFAIRELIRWVFGGGLAYWLAVVIVGVAAGAGALFLVKALVAQRPNTGDSEGADSALKFS